MIDYWKGVPKMRKNYKEKRYCKSKANFNKKNIVNFLYFVIWKSLNYDI